MTDTRKEFQEWWDIAKKNPVPDYGQDSLSSDIAFHSWQACQQLNDKRISDLEATIRNMAAVIAKKDKALREVINVFKTPDYPGICDTVWVTGTRPETLYECAQEALALTADGLELVEVGGFVMHEDKLGTRYPSSQMSYNYDEFEIAH